MNLRDQCVHGRYDKHYVPFDGTITTAETRCPGGSPMVTECGTCNGTGMVDYADIDRYGVGCPECVSGLVTQQGTIEWRCKGIQYSGTKTSKGCPVSWWDGSQCGDGCGLVSVVPLEETT